MGGGTKHDQGKPPLDLVDPEWLWGVGQVLEFGRLKYASHNWRKGIAASRLYSAAMRHLLQWNRGEDLDQESGLSHLLHASCCLQFLYWTMIEHPELDDRYRSPEEQDGSEARDKVQTKHGDSVSSKT